MSNNDKDLMRRVLEPTSSVSVSKVTLKYLNSVKGAIEYRRGEKLTLNDFILVMCNIIDYDLAERFGSRRKNESEDAFQERRINEIVRMAVEEEKEKMRKFCVKCRKELPKNSTKPCPNCGSSEVELKMPIKMIRKRKGV